MAIFYDYVVTVKENIATLNSKIYLYRKNRNIDFYFTIQDAAFRFTERQNENIVETANAAFATIKILNPSGKRIMTNKAEVVDGRVHFRVTESLINEVTEVGIYVFQIDLYDQENGRVTIPPVVDALYVLEPLFDDDDVDSEEISNEVGIAQVGLSYVEGRQVLDAFDENGKYIKTFWTDGDILTSGRLNKIEEAIYEIAANGGGGGGGAKSPYISTAMEENLMVGTGESLNLEIDFSSPNLGAGTLKVFINDVDSYSGRIQQGESTTEISGTLFTKGTNKVVVYVIDRVGNMSNSLTFYVRYGGLEFTTTFDPNISYDVGSNVRYYFVPTSIDTSIPLTFYIEIDGVQSSMSCTSDVRASFTFPNDLAAGRHWCKAWIGDGSSTSTPVEFNLVLLDDNNIVIASNTKNITIEEGYQIVLDYKVYRKNDTTFNTKLYIDDTLISTGICNLETQYYRNSTLTEGTHTIKVEVSDVTNTVTDYITWTITVTASTYELLQPTTSGAIFMATAKNRNNTDENRETWQGTDQDGNKIDVLLNNFTYNSENGWINDALVISGDSSVEIPVRPFSDNAKYGLTVDIEFMTKSIGVENAEVLNIWDDEKNVGIKITTEELIIKSAENEKRLFFSEEENISAIFVIDRDEKTAKIYLNGVMCGGFALGDYVASGVPHLEDFTTDAQVVLGGKNINGYCEIKNIRIYSIALGTEEIKNNYLSNITNKATQKEKVKFQNGDDLPTVTVYGDFSGLGKDDKKPCDIVYQSTDVTKYGESFRLEGKYSMLQYQGTSSMQYPIKNYRLNPRDENGKVKLDPFGNGVKESRFTLKSDTASSGHWQNTGLAKWVNDWLYDYNIKDPKSMNPKKWFDINNGGKLTDTRETINGFPCRLILINDGDTPLQEGQQEPTGGNTKDMGVFNFNNDKSNTKTLGFDTDNFPFCASFEVASNSDTSAGAFMSYNTYVLKAMYNSSENITYIQTMSSEFFNYKNIISYTDGVVVRDVLPYDSNGNRLYSSYPKDKGIPAIVIRFDGDIRDKENIKLNDKTFRFTKVNSITYQIEDPIFYSEGELSYIKDSFELRFPDEDDVGADYGFLNMNGDTTKGLKRVIDFVDKSSDEDFIAHFEEYFNKQYTFRYFLLVMALGMVDNLGKNMMLDTWDGQIFYPRFYDMDTICSFNNSGVITFDTDIEMEQGYWNTSNSRLWTRIRDLFHSELVEIYKSMRQKGLSYERLMHYFYDEQIAKIPESYYNKDYDVKYAPYANEYMGMANGSSYEHLKRWLKRRLLFTDSLYDYVPSYADSITIRANTTEEMRIEIETYVPVYQHMSWYNNQMDKKKIDGKSAVVFTGKAQAATDQEVIIYGGSNIKRIRGISTMNPDSMLIGNATKLVELECNNAPLLTDINSNKANLSPNKYLTKVDISNCPQLGGTLRLNNSPLLSEVNAQGTAITGMLLPTSIKNLAKLKVPKGVIELTLNDAKTLTDLDLEKGYLLETLSLSNCNKLKSFDLSKVKNISLDNSYNAEELRLSTNEQVNLKNMSSLKRLVYTPNNELEDFDLTVLKNSPNVTVSTFNCPQLKDFITTAPQRLSYGKSGNEIYPYKLFMANKLDLSGTQLETVKFLCTTDVFDLKLPKTVKNFYCDSAFDLDTNKITDGNYDVIHSDLIKPYTEENNEKVTIVKEGTFESTKVLNWIEGYSIHPNSGSTTSNSGMKSSDYIEVTGSTAISFATQLDGIYDNLGQYDKDKQFISPTTKLKNQTLYENTKYIRMSTALANEVVMSYTGKNVVPPNIIPTSANGSLLFNINQDTPQNNSPYIWDLQGMKLNDFHTYGVNNKVNAETVIHKIKDKLNWIGLDLNNGADNNLVKGGGLTLPPIKISENMTVFTEHSYTGNPIVVYRICDNNGKVLNRIYGSTKVKTPINSVGNYLIITMPQGGNSGSTFKITINNNIVVTDIDLKDSELNTLDEFMNSKINLKENITGILGDLTSITMPKRLADYKVQIKNADITPNQYNTMLYPKLVDTTLPITGKLNYSKFKGKYLSWAFAYTTNDVVRTALDSRSQGQIINDYNKLYGTDYVDIVDVWAYKDDDFSNRATNNNITKAYIELTQANYKSRIDEVLQWYPNCTELYLFDNNDVTSLWNFMGDTTQNTNSKRKVTKITFMEGYFSNLTSLNKFYTWGGSLNEVHNLPNTVSDMTGAFDNASNLTHISNIPTSASAFTRAFYGCNKLNQQFDFSKLNINKDGLSSTWGLCYSLTYTPILPANYTGNLNSAFQGTKIKTAPVLPNGVTSLSQAFKQCSELTTVGNIPSSCGNYYESFYECKKLTSVPETGWKGNMTSCFIRCILLNQKITIQQTTDLTATFEGCSGLTITPTLPDKINNTNGQMYKTFNGCSKLTKPANTPEGVVNMNAAYQYCINLEQAPYIPDSVTNVSYIIDGCKKVAEITIPLGAIQFNRVENAFQNCAALTRVYWRGIRTTDWNLLGFGKSIYEQEDLKDLVNNHLEDLYKDKIKINYGSKITINNTETTL